MGSISVRQEKHGSGGRQGVHDMVDKISPRNTNLSRKQDLGEQSSFDCGWSLLSHGVAERKRLDLGNLNPIYERELTYLRKGAYHARCTPGEREVECV